MTVADPMDKTFQYTPGRERILIADDTPINRRILAHRLQGKYDIIMATNGRQAIDMTRRESPPDLILLDIMMPEMDGFDVCRRLKEDPITQGIPIIFISARDEVSDQRKGFDLGAVDYITKPFELPLVLARIEVHLRLKRKSEQLERLAMIDALTDIPNRRALDCMLERECRRTRRDNMPLTILMIDVDHFKAYNDHYGHGAGDTCLRAVAKTIEGCLMRPGDRVGRYGGEEFIVILPDCNTVGGKKIAEGIRARVEALNMPHACSPTADHVTISVGINTQNADRDKTCSNILMNADRLLYRAKRMGRNTTCFAEDN